VEGLSENRAKQNDKTSNLGHISHSRSQFANLEDDEPKLYFDSFNMLFRILNLVVY